MLFSSDDCWSIRKAHSPREMQSIAHYEQATRDCGGGPYQILDSESHAGGLLADILPGPVTWYTMSYVCGPSDGKIGGWTVAYLEVGNLNGCRAAAQFPDQTVFQMVHIQSG